jgi:hypothetical protein
LAGEPMNTHDRDASIRWTAVRVYHWVETGRGQA